MMVRIWLNNTSINNMWSVHKIMDSIPSAKELMPQDAYKDLYFFMHFIDDWEADSDNEWDEYFMDPKVESVNTTATY